MFSVISIILTNKLETLVKGTTGNKSVHMRYMYFAKEFVHRVSSQLVVRLRVSSFVRECHVQYLDTVHGSLYQVLNLKSLKR